MNSVVKRTVSACFVPLSHEFLDVCAAIAVAAVVLCTGSFFLAYTAKNCVQHSKIPYDRSAWKSSDTHVPLWCIAGFIHVPCERMFQIPSSTIWKRRPGIDQKACSTFVGPPDSPSQRSRRSIGISRRNARPDWSGKTRSAAFTRSFSLKEVRCRKRLWRPWNAKGRGLFSKRVYSKILCKRCCVVSNAFHV